jgi:hypothetical protein
VDDPLISQVTFQFLGGVFAAIIGSQAKHLGASLPLGHGDEGLNGCEGVGFPT